MSQKKNEGILFPTEIRVVGSYTDRLLNTKIHLTMLCLSGFVLYSRWVPLVVHCLLLNAKFKVRKVLFDDP